MSIEETTSQDLEMMRRAYEQAKQSFEEGGVPVGAVLVDGNEILAEAHNRRVQDGDPIAHGEMSCLRAAGRRKSYRSTTLYTTLSPCMMCAGTIAQFGIPRVVVGERANFTGNVEFLRSQGVDVTVLDDPACTRLMAKFIAESPDLWFEDIAED